MRQWWREKDFSSVFKEEIIICEMDADSIAERGICGFVKGRLKMRQDIIDYLQSEIKRRCELPSNFFGMGCFYHIKAVVDNAVMLAKQFGAYCSLVT